MDCVLLRHGIAVAREDSAGEDSHRALTDKGRTRTRQVARGLESLGVEPTLILTSPFIRAHETAEILHKTLAGKTTVRLCDELIPDAPPDSMIALLAGLPQSDIVVCVGHEPQLGELAGLMLFGKPVGGLSLKKAGACLIRFDETPKAGRGVLEWWLAPSMLRALRKV